MQELATLYAKGIFFEGARWRDGSWWVSDFYTHRVSRVSPDGSATTVVEVEAQPSGLGWLPDGSMVISSMRDHRVLRLMDGRLSVLADLSEHCGGYLNDLVVDAHGHVFVGDFGYDFNAGAPARSTSLKRVDPDGTVTVVAEGLQFPNGSAVTPDGSTLIVCETFGNRCTAWDIAADGSLSNRRVWARFGPDVDLGAPSLLAGVTLAADGCALDAEGCLWVADALFGRVARVAPGGRILEEIQMDDGMGVFSCALGGDGGHTLLLCSAPVGRNAGPAGPREGVLLTTEVEVPAPPSFS